MAMQVHQAEPAVAEAETHPKRLQGVDVARFIAFVGVVCIHASSLSEPGVWAADLGRAAVPFFFVTSGYFIAPDKSDVDAIWSAAKRLVPIYVFWILVFILLYQDWPEGPLEFAKRFVSGGQGYHLWFLPSLGLCVASTVVLRRLGLPGALAVASALYAVGLATGSYNDLWGPEQTFWNPRDGILMGLIFVVSGAFIRAANIRLPLWPAVAALAVLTSLHVVEMSLPLQAGDLYNDFFVLTLPVGVMAFLAALAWHPVGVLAAMLSALGRISLGLYAVHVIFLRLITETFSPSGLLPWVGTVLAVVALSIVTAWTMAKTPYLKRVVS